MDEDGNKVAVILPIKKYERMLQDLEMQEDVALYDKAKKGKQVFVDAKDAFEEIERKRKKLPTLFGLSERCRRNLPKFLSRIIPRLRVQF